MSEWSHLPNAKHIDDLIRSVKDHFPEWQDHLPVHPLRYTAFSTTWNFLHITDPVSWDDVAPLNSAYTAARAKLVKVVYDKPRRSRVGVDIAVLRPQLDAILALTFYNDCPKYLSMSADELQVWIALSENPAAILLLPVVTVYEKIKLKVA